MHMPRIARGVVLLVLVLFSSGCASVRRAYMAHVRENTTFGQIFLKPAYDAKQREAAIAEWQSRWDAMEGEMRIKYADYDHIVYGVFEPALASSELLKREFRDRGADPVAAYDLGRRLVIEGQLGIASSGSVGTATREQVRSGASHGQSPGDTIQPNAYGPGVHSNQYGQPVRLVPDAGAVPGELLRVKPDAYGSGVHMDQYGRPVREVPAFGN